MDLTDGRGGDEDLGVLLDDRPAHIAVVQEHVGPGHEPGILHLIPHPYGRAAEVSLDPAAENQSLPVDGHLTDLALRP